MKARINDNGVLEVMHEKGWVKQRCIPFMGNEKEVLCGVKCPAFEERDLDEGINPEEVSTFLLNCQPNIIGFIKEETDV